MCLGKLFYKRLWGVLLFSNVVLLSWISLLIPLFFRFDFLFCHLCHFCQFWHSLSSLFKATLCLFTVYTLYFLFSNNICSLCNVLPSNKQVLLSSYVRPLLFSSFSMRIHLSRHCNKLCYEFSTKLIFHNGYSLLNLSNW